MGTFLHVDIDDVERVTGLGLLVPGATNRNTAAENFSHFVPLSFIMAPGRDANCTTTVPMPTVKKMSLQRSCEVC